MVFHWVVGYVIPLSFVILLLLVVSICLLGSGAMLHDMGNCVSLSIVRIFICISMTFIWFGCIMFGFGKCLSCRTSDFLVFVTS